MVVQVDRTRQLVVKHHFRSYIRRLGGAEEILERLLYIGIFCLDRLKCLRNSGKAKRLIRLRCAVEVFLLAVSLDFLTAVLDLG